MSCSPDILTKPEIIGRTIESEGLLLRLDTRNGRRFAAVAVTSTGENKPDADRILAAAGDLAVHVDRLGGGLVSPAANLIIVDVKNAARAKERTRSVLLASDAAALFACRCNEAFAAVCMELGLSRSDFAAVAQLYPVLAHATQKEAEAVVGRAHKLCAALRSREIYRHAGYSDDDKAQLVTLHPILADQIARAVRFEIADADSLPKPEADDMPRLARLPYPLCYFEFDSPRAQRTDGTTLGKIRLMVLARDLGGEITSVFFRAHPPGERFFSMGIGARWRIEDGEVLWEPDLLTMQAPADFSDPAGIAHHTALFLGPILSFLAMVNRPDARVTRFMPPARLTAARARGGKVPLFDFHRLDPSSYTTAATAHAQNDEGFRVGPRLHLRRGHMRTLASGREIWIKATVVGNPEAGLIGKDFLLK